MKMNPIEFQNEFENNYREVIKNLLSKLRKEDTIIVCTLHIPSIEYATYVHYLNRIIRKISNELVLKVLDYEVLTKNLAVNDYLRSDDGIHQISVVNRKYAMKLLTLMDLYAPEEVK
jgi:hypothetical protein